jgi:hypothetical protein
MWAQRTVLHELIGHMLWFVTWRTGVQEVLFSEPEAIRAGPTSEHFNHFTAQIFATFGFVCRFVRFFDQFSVPSNANFTENLNLTKLAYRTAWSRSSCRGSLRPLPTLQVVHQPRHSDRIETGCRNRDALCHEIRSCRARGKKTELRTPT